MEDINAQFRTACKAGDVDAVDGFLAGGAVDVSARDNAPLRYAACHNRLPIVRRLLALSADRGVDARAGDNAALRSVCYHGHVDVLWELLAITGPCAVDVHVKNEAPLRLACVNGRWRVVEALLSLSGSKEVDVSKLSPYAFAETCVMGHVEVVRLLLALHGRRRVQTHHNNEAAFAGACAHGHTEVVRALLGAREVDLNPVMAPDALPFSAACKNGHLPVVMALLEVHGRQTVNVHAQDDCAFYMAACANRIPVVLALLALIGPRRIPGAARSLALTAVCKAGHTTLAVHLLSLGVPATHNDSACFHAACAGGHLDIVRVLLGLDPPGAVNVHPNCCPGFVQACTAGHTSVVQELLGMDGHRRLLLYLPDAEKRLEPRLPPLGLPAFEAACTHNHTGVVRTLMALTGDRAVPKHALTAGVHAACRLGHTAVMEQLISNPATRVLAPSLNMACERGYTDIVRMALALKGRRRVNVHAFHERCFRGACSRGQEGVVRELLALQGVSGEVDVHVNEDVAFREACNYKHVGVVRLLLQLTGKREVTPALTLYALREAVHTSQPRLLQALLELDGDRMVDITPVLQDLVWSNYDYNVGLILLRLPVSRGLLTMGNSFNEYITSCLVKVPRQPFNPGVRDFWRDMLRPGGIVGHAVHIGAVAERRLSFARAVGGKEPQVTPPKPIAEPSGKSSVDLLAAVMAAQHAYDRRQSVLRHRAARRPQLVRLAQLQRKLDQGV